MTELSKSLLYLDGVTVSFDGFRALNNLSLVVGHGEMRAIIGPNGAGKTTMMDVITGKTRPDKGDVLFNGERDLTKLDEATIANLGDSRAYLVRKGEIEQISIDHDRTTDGLRMGLSFKEAGEMRMGSALTRVVGRVVIDDEGSCRPDPFEPEVFRLRLLPGDRLVLCSDGVADFAAGPGAPTILAEHAMRDVVEEYEDPVRAAFELVVLANRAGGYDNISCVVIAAHPG